MAKLADLKKQAEELGIDTTDLKTIPELEKAIAEKSAEAPADTTETPKPSRKSKGLIGIKPEDKMRLYKKGGKVVFMTLEEALKPYNFKQLAENSQKAITQGKSATKVLMEIEEQLK